MLLAEGTYHEKQCFFASTEADKKSTSFEVDRIDPEIRAMALADGDKPGLTLTTIGVISPHTD